MITKREKEILETVKNAIQVNDFDNLPEYIYSKFSIEDIVENKELFDLHALLNSIIDKKELIKKLPINFDDENFVGELIFAGLLTEELVIENLDNIKNLNTLLWNVKFSEKFIEDSINKLDINTIFVTKNISNEFIRNHKLEFNTDIIINICPRYNLFNAYNYQDLLKRFLYLQEVRYASN